MRIKLVALITIALSSYELCAADTAALQVQLVQLQQQTLALQAQLNNLQKQLAAKNTPQKSRVQKATKPAIATSKIKTQGKASAVTHKSIHPKSAIHYHQSAVTVHGADNAQASFEFYPTALVADDHVITYIAGTPVVSSPYLGSRPAFDGSDYIVNIPSINRDIRLMQQRRSLYKAYEDTGYPAPHRPIIALSGKLEPIATLKNPFNAHSGGDINLGSSELDVAAALNEEVEAYLGLAYDAAPPDMGGQRLSNSSIDLNMGFVNIGNLARSPLYFTAGQLYVPFGRFASAMVSSPLTLAFARTKSRPIIFGYKSQQDSGVFAAVYGYRSDTTLGSSAAGGLNFGYIFNSHGMNGEIGASVISAINNSGGMQFTGSAPGTTFGGFSSYNNGSELVRKIPAIGVHANLGVDRYNFTAEWVGASSRFRPQDLSFNGVGAQPQALQLEAGMTFKAFNKPASLAAGYQWSKDTLALNIPQQRLAGVFSISIWKDTIESLEYRHDVNFSSNQYANGAAPIGMYNANTIGQGGFTDTLLAQIGVFF